MRPLERRITALEALQPPRSRAGGLDREIAAMDSDERDIVRAFLVNWKSGSKPGDPEHDRLRRLASDAVFAARDRL
jgi:hypothetical protein